MALSPGSRLGPYEILAPLGAGGMGEVYRARDSRLDREVAIKVLPPDVAADAKALSRFEREAKAIAALSHPNILAIHDFGAAGGITYAVTELLEGETLRQRLDHGALPIRRSGEIAREIALGLAAAHEKGIVHRDLKPENLFLTRDGLVKILDFGLARQIRTGGDPLGQTLTDRSEPGAVLGTAGYMSPEQVRGEAADHRSDIFSLGAVLYEMVSGKRAFRGETSVETMNAILREEPPAPSESGRPIPPALERLVAHCLEKTTGDRFQSARDLAFDLASLSTATSGTGVAPAPGRSNVWRVALAAAAAIAVVAAAGYLVNRRAAPASAPRSYRRLTSSAGGEFAPALSPDGQILAFVKKTGGKNDIWIKRAGGQNSTDLTADCDKNSYSPAFSPDGNFIAYGSLCGGSGLFLMGATGENIRRLTDIGSDPAWSPDGKEIVFNTEAGWRPSGRATTSELWIADVATGKTRRIFAGDAVQPNVSPHGHRIAFWGVPGGSRSQRDIWTIPYRGLAAHEKPVPVTQDPTLDWNPVWSEDGRFLYFLSNRDGTMNLWRVPIDEKTGKTLGPLEPRTLPAHAAAGLAVSRDGKRLAYVADQETFSLERLPFEPSVGRLRGQPVEILQTSQTIQNAVVSPDGSLIAFDSRGSEQEDIFLVKSDGTGLRKLTDDPRRDRSASFSPDGKRIVFQSERTGGWEIWTIRPDGGGLTQLTRANEGLFIPLWSPDGQRIAASNGSNVSILELDGRDAVVRTRRLPDPPGNLVAMAADWTRDGRLLVTLNRKEFSGQADAAIYSFDTGSYRIINTAAGFTEAVILPPDRLLFRAGEGIWLTDLAGIGERLLLPHPKDGSYVFVSATRDGTALYLDRSLENADIWEASPP